MLPRCLIDVVLIVRGVAFTLLATQYTSHREITRKIGLLGTYTYTGYVAVR